MGKGDKRSRRGKISKGSFGNARPKARKKVAKKATGKPGAAAKTGVKKKPAAKK